MVLQITDQPCHIHLNRHPSNCDYQYISATLAEIRDLSTADDTLNSSHRSNYFKPMGIRNTFLTTKGISTNITSQQTAQSAAVGTAGNSLASTQTQLNNNNNLGLSSSSPEPTTPREYLRAWAHMGAHGRT